MRRLLKLGGALVLGIVLVVGGGLAAGVLGVPSLSGVDNRFGPVNDTTTVIYTDLHVTNPNPVGVQVGDVTITYSVAMNDVAIAGGRKQGVGVETGNSTLNLTTAMRNERIPAWWYTHVREGEETAVDIDADVETPFGQATVGRSRTIETDIVGQFDSNETRPVNASQPLVSDPVLYINSTRGDWDRANLTRERTPLDLDFTVYNPKPVPYTVTKIGYNVTMNGVPVGAGETERGYVIEPETTETIRANAAIRNEHLDEWWVTHLERGQVTDLKIDFYLIVEFGGDQFRIDLDSIDYEKRIETDIFGNKATSGTETGTGPDTGTETTTATETATPTDTPTPTPTDTATSTDDGILDTETSTQEPTSGETATATPTPTPTPTDSGGETTTTDDGLL